MGLWEILFSIKTRNPKDPIYLQLLSFLSVVLSKFVKNAIYMISN